MDSVISIYNGLNNIGKILYLYNLNRLIDFIEGKEIEPVKIIHPNHDDRGGYLECYEQYIPKINDPELKAKCERFIKLRKENIALLDELNI
jgi:hypothetical protein